MHRRTGLSGFTVVEALFLALLGVFAAMVLLPMLARVRCIPNRMTCGVQLAGIGKAMLLYASDYEGEFPRAGVPDSSWAARTPNWLGKSRQEAFGAEPNGVGGQASISASLYLLVRCVEIVPKQFLCIYNGHVEKGASEFQPAAYGVKDEKLADFWDFGPDPPRHCSYAYHMVYGPRRLTVSTESGTPVAADRNPWMGSPSAIAKDFSRFKPDLAPFGGTAEQARYGNSISHREQGQNVLFQDTHVAFEKWTCCGVENDNIYTSWDGTDRIRGQPPELGSQPADGKDSLLVNDPPVSRK